MNELNEHCFDSNEHSCKFCWRFVTGGYCRLTSPYTKALQDDLCDKFIHNSEIPKCLALDGFKTSCKQANYDSPKCIVCLEKLGLNGEPELV